jgi:hypothetical protein
MSQTCLACGAALTPMKHQGNPKKCCGPACNARLHRMRKGNWVRGESRTCLGCGEEFKPYLERSWHCSPQCWSAARDRAQSERRARTWKSCADCGVPVKPKGGRIPLCASCSRERTLEWYRYNNRRRRTLGQIRVKYSLAEIGDRDGWRCHLCSRRVDRTLPGSRPDGPTIDHLIPIADGGTDEPANVALAHRSCNVKRGRKGVAQLRMIG